MAKAKSGAEPRAGDASDSPVGTPVTDIPSVGPATAAAFARAGVTTAEQVRAMGADAAYLALMRSGTPPHFIGYYVLVMGLMGRPWNDAQGPEKAALRVKFDALKAQARSLPPLTTPPDPTDNPPPAVEAALDALGVRPARK